MLERIKEQIPDIAKDVRINLGKVLDLDQNDGLNREQIVGSALAVAYALNDEDLIEQLKERVESDEVINAVKLAVSLMSLTNIYYRFVHLSEDSELSHVPAGLRMQGMMNPGVDRVTFESFCLAVSAINGCGMCISSHVKQLREHNLSAAAIARIGRISAVINAVSVSRTLGH